MDIAFAPHMSTFGGKADSAVPLPTPAGAIMGTIKLLATPIRSIVRFPLFQLAIVVAVILFLQAADDKSARGQMFNGLDKLVESTVGLFSALFNVKSFTKSWLTTGFWIAYVYLACLLILSLLRVAISAVVDFVGWSNAFWLRSAIARERGIAAYRAWVPLERIRPVNIPQEKWEETFAWPANNEPPYPAGTPPATWKGRARSPPNASRAGKLTVMGHGPICRLKLRPAI
jgi:hypothetical protein